MGVCEWRVRLLVGRKGGGQKEGFSFFRAGRKWGEVQFRRQLCVGGGYEKAGRAVWVGEKEKVVHNRIGYCERGGEEAGWGEEGRGGAYEWGHRTVGVF